MHSYSRSPDLLEPPQSMANGNEVSINHEFFMLYEGEFLLFILSVE